MPSANVIELTVTVFPVPTFLLLNVDEFVLVTVSDPINPDKDNVTVAADELLYTLLDAVAVAVNALAKALTATATASNKVYNSSSAATVTLSLSGFIGSETVTSTNSSTFNNKNVGTGKTVTVNSITLADGTNGGLASNYSISTGQTTTAVVVCPVLIE